MPYSKLYSQLNQLGIAWQAYEHPPAPDIETARKYWVDIEATHCKNVFFRNHKGNRHYLVVLEHTQNISIHDLEKRLKQGKLSFASPERLHRYLGVMPGSVTPFGLINDTSHHVHVFFDANLQKSQTISFHPLINTISIVVKFTDFMHFMASTGNTYEFISLYDE
jgi:Ala-tRNA(Pro) deacylase